MRRAAAKTAVDRVVGQAGEVWVIIAFFLVEQ